MKDLVLEDPDAPASDAAKAPIRLPTPPQVRKLFGISSRLPLQAFLMSLKKNGVGMVVDVRPTDAPMQNDAWHHPSNLNYLCLEVFGIGYERAPELVPLPEWWAEFEQAFVLPNPAGRDRTAWNRYLAKYLASLAQRGVLGERGVLRRLLGLPCQAIAFLCACAHPEDCHRCALLGYLRTQVEGLSVGELSEDQLGFGSPPAREIPMRYRVADLPEASLGSDIPSVIHADGRMQGVILSSHEDAAGKHHLDVAVDTGGAYRFLHLRIPSNAAIDHNWVGVSAKEMRRYAAPGYKLTFTPSEQKLDEDRWPTHPEQILIRTNSITLHRTTVSREELAEIMSHAISLTVKHAFPTAVREANNQAYVDASVALERSAAYVRCTRVNVDVRSGKAIVFDGQTSVRGELLDRELLALFQTGGFPDGYTIKDTLVRLVLLPPSSSAQEPASRCYLAIGYVQR